MLIRIDGKITVASLFYRSDLTLKNSGKYIKTVKSRQGSVCNIELMDDREPLTTCEQMRQGGG